MSCMELTKNHYQFVGNQLYKILVKFNKRIEFYKTRKEFDGNFVEKEEKIISFINRLQSWNVKAFDERYPQDCDPSYSPDYVTRINFSDAWNPHQLLKALECIDYQCSDSSEYCDSEDRKLLKLIKLETMKCILEVIEEYKSAKWGIE